MTSSSSSSRGCVANARASSKSALIYRSQVARRCIRFRGQPDEIDRFVGLRASGVEPAIAQEGPGHHVRQHCHLAERPRNLERAG